MAIVQFVSFPIPEDCGDREHPQEANAELLAKADDSFISASSTLGSLSGNSRVVVDETFFFSSSTTLNLTDLFHCK